MTKSLRNICANCKKKCTKMLKSRKIKKMRDDGFVSLYGVSIHPQDCKSRKECKKRFDKGFKEGFMQTCLENCQAGSI